MKLRLAYISLEGAQWVLYRDHTDYRFIEIPKRSATQMRMLNTNVRTMTATELISSHHPKAVFVSHQYSVKQFPS